MDPTADARRAERPPHRLVGRLLDGRYRVTGHIADGGMASVWRAVDERLERDVAVKVLRPGLGDDPVFVKRFSHEARSAARLNDPRVVAVYDQGSDGDDRFLVMELVPGETLREVVHRDAPLTPRAALDLMIPVAHALGVAHAAGIMHRDVKPENVIIREDGQVKVADFGLARAVTTSTTAVTGAGAGSILGTVSYLSPEQVAQGTSDARSDVYAAGILLFELLTGRKPFEGESPIHVAYQHVHSSVPAPSSIAATVPPALDSVVAHATARDPEGRPADGRALADELEKVRAGLDPAQLDARRPATSPTAVLPLPDRGGSGASAPRRAGVPAGSTAPLQRQPAHPPTRRRRSALLLLLPLLLVLALAGAGGWWFLAGPGATTTVPDVGKVSLAAARARLASAHLDATAAEAFSETAPRGTVLAVTPAAGTELHRGDDVRLTVSKGPERYAVPDVAGKTLDEARAALTGAHLAVGSVGSDYDEKVPEGSVVSASPAAGTPLKPATPVALVVSKGRRPVDVPSLVGSSLDSARSQVADAGLGLDVASDRVFSSTVPAGAVASQQPSSGTLHLGDTVTVTLSKGPEMVTVPDVVGEPSAAAAQQLRAAGFQVSVERYLGGIFDTVRLQSVKGGATAPKGSTITITLV